MYYILFLILIKRHGIRASGDQGIRVSGYQKIRGSGYQDIRKSGNQGIRISGGGSDVVLRKRFFSVDKTEIMFKIKCGTNTGNGFCKGDSSWF